MVGANDVKMNSWGIGSRVDVKYESSSPQRRQKQSTAALLPTELPEHVIATSRVFVLFLMRPPRRCDALYILSRYSTSSFKMQAF
jgi:hypothetical protein